MYRAFLLLAVMPLWADPVCHKCEVIREYNKQHPGGEYEYYEDYLGAEKTALVEEKK